VMVIVKKPAVDVGLAKCGLDGVEVHGVIVALGDYR
jgi:hypothetical protein